jgi:hypothetical protein
MRDVGASGCSGALYTSAMTAITNFAYGGCSYPLSKAIAFDAARYNPIYGSSETVQPPAVNMLIGEYVVSGVSEIDIVTSNEIIKGIDALQADVGKVVKEDRLEKYNTAYITETWSSGTEWYRIWSDGWIEQGGKTSVMTSNVITTITLYKTMKDTNYNVTTCERYDSGTSDNNNENYWISTISNTSFGVYNSAGGYKQLYWNVCGY